MDIDLDQLARQASGWDLAITLKGRRHVVKAITAADALALQEAGKSNKPDKAKALVAAVGQLFETPPADIETWTPQELARVIGAVGQYAREFVSKNSPAAAATAAAAEVSRLSLTTGQSPSGG